MRGGKYRQEDSILREEAIPEASVLSLMGKTRSIDSTRARVLRATTQETRIPIRKSDQRGSCEPGSRTSITRPEPIEAVGRGTPPLV